MRTKPLIAAILILFSTAGCRLFKPNMSTVYDRETYPDGTLYWFYYAKSIGKQQCAYSTVYHPNGKLKEIEFTAERQIIYKVTLDETGNILSEHLPSWPAEY